MSRCDTCKFFNALKQECRKNPPTVFPLPTRDGGVGSVGIWPPTRPENWCGAHETAVQITT